MRPMPSPETTATTLVVGGGPVPSRLGPAPGAPTLSRTQRSSSTCSSRSVTRMRCGRPASTPASMAAPTSSVWMWQFHRPSPPTTTMESPMPAHTSLNASMDSSGAESRYMTSYRRSPTVCVPSPDPEPSDPPVQPPLSDERSGASTPEGCGSGRPSSTRRNASSRRRNPAPPASTTPAWASTGSISGVRARVSAASPRALSTTPTRPEPLAAPAAAAEATVRMVPSTGRTTARRARSEAWVMASTRRSGPTPASPAVAMRSLIPRRSCDRITPEFPRAPISEPCPIALQTSSRPASSAHTIQLGDDGLEGQGHVRARVPVGHRVDVQPVDVGLVQPERVPVPPHDGAEVAWTQGGWAEGRRGGHGRGC